MRYLATLHQRYLLCSSADGLHVLDRRGAHAALLAAQLSEQVAAGEAEAQRLLFPSQLTLEPHQATAAADHAGLLIQLGFECEPFGGSDHIVRRIPVVLRSRDPGATLRSVLDAIARGEHVGLVNTIAADAAVRTGEPFDTSDVAALLRGLDQVASPLWGRFVRDVPITEVARWFQSS